jgi:ribose-phosphate pyrophosphokinase
VAGTAHPDVAGAAAGCLGTELVSSRVERLPDGELRPVLAALPGDDVYVVQPTGPPGNEYLVELLLLLDACRRAGAGRLTAVVPCLVYARQDRRTTPGEAVAARVVTNLIVVHKSRVTGTTVHATVRPGLQVPA